MVRGLEALKSRRAVVSTVTYSCDSIVVHGRVIDWPGLEVIVFCDYGVCVYLFGVFVR